MQLNSRAWDFITPLALIGGLTIALGVYILTLIIVLSVVALVVFFRDPNRTPPETGVVAPADGRIRLIETDGEHVRIGIFLNIHNVHVIRAPTATTLTDNTHYPGGNLPAMHKNADRNERFQFSFTHLTVDMIAGVLIRRTHSYITPGDTVTQGQRIGHIDFGSRVDITLPEQYTQDDLLVNKWEHVRAGETLLVEKSPS